MKLILTAADHPAPAEAGGKAAALARLSDALVPVPPPPGEVRWGRPDAELLRRSPSASAAPTQPPPAGEEQEAPSIPAWFVVTADAFRQSVPDPAAGDFRVAPAVEDAVRDALAALPGDLFAVRSSAVDEDGSDHSFAGQLESYLFVSREDVLGKIVAVWKSGFTDRVFAYRREHGLAETPSPPAVLVQRMIDSGVAGVAFAADPIHGHRDVAVVSAVFGLGTALVGGDAEADLYRVDRAGGVVEQKVVRKSLKHVADPSAETGVRVEQVPDALADRPTLTPSQAAAVAALARRVSDHEGRPQDIEWAMKDGRLYLLQSRPITSLSALADPAGVKAIWDNSNIAESYNGVTTPLTFSFAQRAYEGAYRSFCELMKVPQKVITGNDAMFGQMLGLIRGRIYYNLLNWYRLLAMLPGFSVNQRFMEQMMGVRHGLPAEIADGVLHKTWSQRQGDKLRLAWRGAGLAWNHLVLPRKIKKFYQRLDAAMAPPTPPLARMRLDQLTAEFRKLESQLLSRWDAPLINDFLAMMFFGTLGKLAAKWAGGGEALHNDLISEEGGIISTEPVRRIASMAKLAAVDSSLVDALCESDAADVVPRLRAIPGLRDEYDAYLDKFGDRCLEELKLESSTLTDDPTPLLRTIGQTARRNASAASPVPPPPGEVRWGRGASNGSDKGNSPAADDTSVAPTKPYRPRAAAEEKVAEALRDSRVKRLVFNWVLKHTRGRVRDRENLRFERTRLFGRVRRIMVEAGRRLVAEGLLDRERDVFYLTLDEVLAYVEGTAVDTDLKSLARRRIEQFRQYKDGPPPADRFETRGAVYLGNRFEADEAPPATEGGLRGTGCCPGVVRGVVRLIRDPRGAHLRHGEILVAERTDPGWIMLFPAAAGVLVERGSLLSHSAIVARELGIPAIVSVPDLMRTLQDGQTVEMNGSTGTITVIPSDTTI